MSAEKPTILVVEDEPKMRRLLELQLGDEGFDARSAADAESGLQLLNREKFDLIVTDFKLPGMNGLEFLQAAKRANADVAVVERVAPTNSTVLIGGESGVSKDLIARAIHEHSRHASGPFIKINSTAI